MISINYNGDRIEWVNRLEELKIGQLDEINNIVFNYKNTEIENYIELINYFTNIPTDEIEKWNYYEFQLLCENMFKEIPNDLIRKDIIIYDNIEYKLKEIDFNKNRDIYNLEKCMKIDIYKISNLLSYLYDIDIEIIKDMELIDFLYIILEFNKNILNNYKILESYVN